jgi:putative DNA primase/helicase
MATLFAGQGGRVGFTAVGVSRHISSSSTHVENALYRADDLGFSRLARDARELSLRARAVYVTLNPVSRDGSGAPRNGDIERRRWLLIDPDPVRPADCSATFHEKLATRLTAINVRRWLSEAFGFPRPILADSGNGYHLLYRIDLPNDEPSTKLVRAVLENIAERWDSAEVTIDRRVYDARRVTKLYGTLARKGPHSSDRPHRVSALLEIPDPVAVLTRSQLSALAAAAPQQSRTEFIPFPLNQPKRGQAGPATPQQGRTEFIPFPLTPRGRGPGTPATPQSGRNEFLSLPPTQSERSKHAPGPRRGLVARAVDLVDCYARAALDRELGALSATAPGQRNNRLFASASALYELVNAGSLDESEVTAALQNAARSIGLEDAEIASALRSARKTTRGKARDLSRVGQAPFAAPTQPRSQPASTANACPEPAAAPNSTPEAEPGRAHALALALAPDPTANEEVRERDDDPYRLARRYLANQVTHADGPTLVHWNDEWWAWSLGAGHWRVLPDTELSSAVTLWLKREMDRIALEQGTIVKPLSTSSVGNVAHMLRALVTLPTADVPEQPAWLRARPDDPAVSHCLATRNAIVDLPALTGGGPTDRSIRPATPRFFSANALAYAFDPQPPRPDQWLAFLQAVWGADSPSIDALQEWFGYLLTPDTAPQKILLILGPRRSGKGTIARTLRALVGESNVAAPTLSSLAGPFGLQPLLGKSLCICPESRITGRADTQAIVERLLSISGEDPQTVDRKHRTPWHGTLRTRFVLLGNEFPRLSDYSDAILGRLVVLKLTESWQGKEDLDLSEKLRAELPGILLWSIAGWQRLRERRRFLQPASGLEDLREAAGLINPIGAFLSDCCVLGSDLQVSVGGLYNAWKGWCQRNGRDHPGDVAGFGRSLKAQPGLKIREYRPNVGGLRVRHYLGIALKPEDEDRF